MIRNVCMFSGGITSWAAAKRVVEQDGVDGTVLLFADTRIEDPDLYRFLEEGAQNVGAPLVRIQDGRTPWEVFRDVRYMGNTRVDPCSKILKRELLDRWVRENAPGAVTVVGLAFDEPERIERFRARMAKKGRAIRAPLAEKPWVSSAMAREWAEQEGLRLPRLYELGFVHNNPMSGETRVITSEGTKTLRDLSGTNPILLGRRSRWVQAEVRSFGAQPLMRLTVSRYGRTKALHATPDHRWFRRSSARGNGPQVEVLTEGLRPGDSLVSMFSVFSPSVRPSAFGIAHGIVFGDGTLPRYSGEKRGWNPPANVVLCGTKSELLEWFPGCPTREVPGVGVRVNDLPHYFRKRPSLKESKSYLYGWLAGYFAADGKVDQDGSAVLSSANLYDLQFARDVSTLIGVATLGIRTEERVGINGKRSGLYSLPFVKGTLPREFFLHSIHSERFAARKSRVSDWRVVSVEATGRSEEVFCALVPDGHSFTLEDNILTGNCGGFCVKAGHGAFAALLQHFPERYQGHEQQEEEFRQFLGRDDVSILRDRRGGKTRPMTLREFRQRVQGGGDFDRNDHGGCGCAIDDQEDG